MTFLIWKDEFFHRNDSDFHFCSGHVLINYTTEKEGGKSFFLKGMGGACSADKLSPDSGQWPLSRRPGDSLSSRSLHLKGRSLFSPWTKTVSLHK